MSKTANDAWQHDPPATAPVIPLSVGDTFPDPLIQLDRQWRITVMNAAAADLFATTPPLVLHHDFWQSFPHLVGGPVFVAFHQAWDEGRIVEVQDYYPKLEKWYIWRVCPLPQGLLILGRDVTQAHRETELNQQQETHYEQILSVMTDGVLELDAQGTITYANPVACRLLGCSTGRLIGTSIHDLMLPERRVAQALTPTGDMLVQALRSGQPTPALFRRADGSIQPVEFNLGSLLPSGSSSHMGVSSQVMLLRCRKTQNQVRDILEQSRGFLRGVFDTIGAHICILDHNGTIVDINQAWRNYARANQNPDPTCGMGINYVTLCENLRGKGQLKAMEIAVALRDLLEGKRKQYELEYPCHSSSRNQWFLMRVNRLEHDGQVFAVVAHHDITQRKLAEIQSQHDSLHDALTGLPNRVQFQERLQHRLKRAKIDNDYNFAVLFIDLDHFKNVNDSLGHTVGDQLLKEASNYLYESLRKSMVEFGLLEYSFVLARQGGDEFMVLLEKVDSLATLRAIVSRMQPEEGLRFQIDGHEVFTSASIGVVQGDPRYTTTEALVRDGDIAMYRAKANGRGRHEIFDQTMHAKINQRLQIENDVRQALHHREFELYYQPIITLENGHVLGLEALVRWRREDGTYIPPNEFIPMAEESDLIIPLGKWVVEEACRRLGQWSKTHPSAAELAIHVNLSQRQLCAQDDLVQFIQQSIGNAGIRPSQLHLEITESAIMTNPDVAGVQLQSLRGLGVKIDIDDFGTGYSSLSYLHRLPLDGLKIDRAFIANLARRRDYPAVVQAIVALAHNLNMHVVAEGIETRDQLVQLQTLECDAGQGFFFAKPLSVDEVRKLLSTKMARVA